MLDQLGLEDLDDIAPPDEDESLPDTVDPQKEFESFGFFRRLMVYLQAIVAGRPKEEVVVDLLLKELSREIQGERRDIVDFRRGVALRPFAQELDDIRDAAERLSRALTGIESVNLGVLSAVILGVTSPDIYSRLLMETDPFVVAKEESELPPFHVKKRCLRNLEDALLLLPTELQDRIAADSVALSVLKRLIHLDLSLALRPFEEGEATDAPLHALKQPIVNIAELLYRRRFVPSDRLLKGIYLILKRTDPSEEQTPPEEWARHVTALLRRLVDLSEALPLTPLARYLQRDLHYVPRRPESPGDWMAHLKRFWTGRLEKQYQAFVAEEKKRAILLEASEWITTNKFPGYPAVDPGETGTHAFSVAILQAVLRKLAVGEEAQALKALLIEGDFYKEQNRADFTDAYNGISRRLEEISELETRVAPEGGLTRRLEAVARQGSSLGTIRAQRRTTVRAFDADVEAIIRRGVEDIRILHDVLSGILYGEIGGHYDTLANLTDIAGRGNKGLMAKLADLVTFLKKTQDVVGKVFDVERNAARRLENLESRLA
jgi:hypothetical protein